MAGTRIGIIGAGNMGGRIGRRLREAGESVVAFDRDEERLASSDLDPAASVGELVEGVDVVLLSLPDSSVIEPVVSRPVMPGPVVPLPSSSPRPTIEIALSEMPAERSSVKARSASWREAPTTRPRGTMRSA